jgi:hypothetical protein
MGSPVTRSGPDTFARGVGRDGLAKSPGPEKSLNRKVTEATEMKRSLPGCGPDTFGATGPDRAAKASEIRSLLSASVNSVTSCSNPVRTLFAGQVRTQGPDSIAEDKEDLEQEVTEETEAEEIAHLPVRTLSKQTLTPGPSHPERTGEGEMSGPDTFVRQRDAFIFTRLVPP